MYNSWLALLKDVQKTSFVPVINVTPGVGVVREQHESRARAIIPASDLAIFVLSLNQSGRKQRERHRPVGLGEIILVTLPRPRIQAPSLINPNTARRRLAHQMRLRHDHSVDHEALLDPAR